MGSPTDSLNFPSLSVLAVMSSLFDDAISYLVVAVLPLGSLT